MKINIWIRNKLIESYSKWKNIFDLKDGQQALAAVAAFITFWVCYGMVMENLGGASMIPAGIASWGVFIFIDAVGNAGGISLKRVTPWWNALTGFFLISLIVAIFFVTFEHVWRWVQYVMAVAMFVIGAGVILYFIHRSDKQLRAHESTRKLFSGTKEYEGIVFLVAKEIEAKRKIDSQSFDWRSVLEADRDKEVIELKKKIIREFIGYDSEITALFPKPADLLQKIYVDAYDRAEKGE
jgi:hypothetical protein